jgi:hypothetical protein
MSKLTQHDWEDALNVEDARNLSGVLTNLFELRDKIWNDVRDTTNGGTHDFNTHPIVRMFVYKMFQLAFEEPLGEHSCDAINAQYDKAYKVCKEKSND